MSWSGLNRKAVLTTDASDRSSVLRPTLKLRSDRPQHRSRRRMEFLSHAAASGSAGGAEFRVNEALWRPIADELVAPSRFRRSHRRGGFCGSRSTESREVGNAFWRGSALRSIFWLHAQCAVDLRDASRKLKGNISRIRPRRVARRKLKQSALVRADTPALARLYADDLVSTNYRGVRSTKATLIAAIAAGGHRTRGPASARGRVMAYVCAPERPMATCCTSDRSCIATVRHSARFSRPATHCS